MPQLGNTLDAAGRRITNLPAPSASSDADRPSDRDAAIQAAVDLITAVMATDSEVAAAVSAAVSAHEADSTNVHGVADMTQLATNAAVTSAVSNAIAALGLGDASQRTVGTGAANLPTAAQVATLISTAINQLVAGAPGLLDTLDEIAQALGDDPNFATTVLNALATKADTATVTAGLAGKLALTGGLLTGATTTQPVALAYGATIAVNATLGNLFRVTLTGNATLGNPSGGVNGQVIRVEVTQNGTGGWTLGYSSKYLGSDDLALPTIASGASKRTVLNFEFDQTADKWLLLGKNAGYQL